MIEAIEYARSLEDDWDGEGAPAPSPDSIARALAVCAWAYAQGFVLVDLDVDIEGGMGVSILSIGDREAWFSTMNNGTSSVVLSTKDSVQSYWKDSPRARAHTLEFLR